MRNIATTERTSLTVLADIVGPGYSCTVLTVEPGSGLDGALLAAAASGISVVRVFDDSAPFNLLDGIAPRAAARLLSRLAFGDLDEVSDPFWRNAAAAHIEAAMWVLLADGKPAGLSRIAALLSDREAADEAAGRAAAFGGEAAGHAERLREGWGMPEQTRHCAFGMPVAFVARFSGHPLVEGLPVESDAVLPEAGSGVLVNRYGATSGPEVAKLAGSFLRLKALSQHWAREAAAKA